MSVSATTNLPGQPPVGTTAFDTFVGTGFMAPLGEYFVDNSLTMDASGGTASVTINMDPRYTNVCAFINLHIVGSATAVEYVITLLNAGGIGGPTTVTVVGRTTLIDTSRTSLNNTLLWYPPALWFQQAGQIIVTVDNVDGDQIRVKTQILVFDSDVRNKVPLNILMLNLPAQGATTPV